MIYMIGPGRYRNILRRWCHKKDILMDEKECEEPKFKLIEIEWIDSCSGPETWSFIDEMTPFLPVEVRTVGFVIDDNDEAITVAHSLTKSKKQVSGLMTIPKVSIISSSYL